MTIITSTESNNNHLNLKYIIYGLYLKLEMITFNRLIH